MKSLLCLIGMLFLVDSALADKVKIESDPSEAEVFVRELGQMSYKKIGKTPLETSFKELKTYFVKSSVFLVEVRQKGFNPYRVTVNDISGAE
ncbi:MAG: hypothetical protein ACPGJV_09190, partial [Bacteriovoracaceae bacterium]